MTTDLQTFIEQTPLCDTHEHLHSERHYTENGPDILQALFDNYVTADLVVAGADQTAVTTLIDQSNPDLRARFQGVATAWQAIQQTGYGEAVRLIARELYAIEEISAETIEAAQARHAALLGPDQRLHLLRDQAGLDHVQIDDFKRQCRPDTAGVDFFLYDISWVDFANGEPNLAALTDETGVTIHDLPTLARAMATVFAQEAPCAVAIKSQHAYSRTLRWQERSDDEAAKAFAQYLRDPAQMTPAERLCLGDWALGQGVALAIEHHLPIKIHTGYYAGHSRMPTSYIRAGHLSALLAKYPTARFVLMHTAYPYGHELIALAKHYPNVYVDLCWAWSIDPYSTTDFVRRLIHAVPANKLFAFGGDTFWPMAAVAYTAQCRTWLARTLQAEIDDGLLAEKDAIALAERFMRTNQYECFHLEAKRAQIRHVAAGN